MTMNGENKTPCANSLFCCKEKCLQNCETIKKDLNVIKEGFIKGNPFDVFCIKYEDILLKLNELQYDFEKRENNFISKKDILEKLDKRKEILRNNKAIITFRKIIVIIILVMVQFFLIYMRDNLFDSNTIGTVLICIIISVILIVQMVIILEMVLFYYKNNIIINKLEMLILKVEMSSDYNYKDAERELQLITRLWDNKSILDVFIKH